MFLSSIRKHTPGTVTLVAILVFLFFFFVYGSVKALYPGSLTSSDDPYFHARYAALLAEGVESPPLPFNSTMSWWGGGSIYYGYHKTLATLLTVTGSTDSDERLIIVTKIFNAALAAAVFAVYFLVTARCMRTLFPRLSSRRVISIALLSTLLLLLIFPQLPARLSYERPFVFSVLLMILILYALVEQRHRLLFVVGSVFPLVYSFTLIAYIPVTVHAFVQARVLGLRAWRAYTKPFLVLTGGLALGIFLHPTSLHYIFNAYYIILFVLFNALTSTIPLGSEIKPMLFTITDYLWIGIAGLLIIGVTQFWKKHTTVPERALFFLTVLSVVYIPLQILFPRTVEYFGPVAMMAATFLCTHLYTEHKNIVLRLKEKLSGAQQKVVLTALVVFLGIGITAVVFGMTQHPKSSSIANERELYRIIGERAEPGDRVVLTAFHTFTTAYFFLPELSYNQGMDPTFSLVASSSMFWLLHHAVMDPEHICPEDTCVRSDMDTYEVLHTTYNARFVIVDYYTDESPYATSTTPLYARPIFELLNTISKKMNDNTPQDVINPYEQFADGLLADARYELLLDTTTAGRRYVAFEVLDE